VAPAKLSDMAKSHTSQLAVPPAIKLFHAFWFDRIILTFSVVAAAESDFYWVHFLG